MFIQVYQFWTGETIPLKNNDSTAIENRFYKTGKIAPFLDLSRLNSNPTTQWLFETTTGFELENGGSIPFIPTDRFDAIISVKSSRIPTYD